MTHQCEYQGCKGVKAIAERFGVNYSTLLKRLQRGFDIEQAVTMPRCAQVTQVKYAYKGLKGVRAISKSVGISEATLYGRLSEGMTLKEAIEMPKKKTGMSEEHRKANQVGIKKPEALSSHWALALGAQL
ncbi:conserved hypothetical protein [Vibrio coralliirubri]|uniref:hypothetical protein n=1 Tax=Vibrio coralliirubri TaxID=1516159 RepID=UPI0006301315|nr:hypothetical protein [Vibrio coralliirubri]CDT98662.1 conserved hypothetical protein [Vibrio coralliirubri]